MLEELKVGIVHDWLVGYGGAERVLEQMVKIFPQAQLFCLVDFLAEADRAFINYKQTYPSFIQHLPLARSHFRYYLPLMPLAIEQLDLRQFDLIISSSHAVAKGVITSPDQIHIAYIHTPMRYVWDLQADYLQPGLKSFVSRLVFHYLRAWDVASAMRVDRFIANSNFIRQRIAKTYRRKAAVVYPPVNIKEFPLKKRPPEDFYLSVSRLVPYKRVDLIVDAFAQMPNRKLVVIGDGQERKKIEARLTPNITYLGYQSQAIVGEYMQRARGFVFAGIEDFGITPLEALSCGTPVIALAKGGLKETIKPHTGILYKEQTIESLQDGIHRFEQSQFDAQVCHHHAEKFNPDRFCKELREKISQILLKKSKKHRVIFP